MQRIRVLCWLLLFACPISYQTVAQESPPTTCPLIVSAIVGEVIDAQEKATYGLFSYYAADNFVEARFEQNLLLDSTIRLRTLLRDGRTMLRPFSSAEFAAVRETIETRKQELNKLPRISPYQIKLPFSNGRRWYRVELHSGAVIEGEELLHYRKRIELLTADSGLVVVERTDIARIEPLPQPGYRLKTRFSVGNGHRLFLVPTARNLRRGEGYVQQTDGLLFGATYGFTNNFSAGVFFSAVPTVPLRDQFLLFTPKLTASLSEKWHVGGGVMYVRLPKLDPEFEPIRAGIGYGVVTYGSADDNVSVGLGYSIDKNGIDHTPVLHYGAQKRISRGWSLVNENFLLINSEPGTFGLFGTRYANRRFSFGLGGIYAVPFSGPEDPFVVLPVYLDLAFRFGRGSRY
ncbi:hypothetical protein [Hymenobacter sp. YC55]|uniref:hypothetical protein n=1 Tax=Hymenobacter sp. YC55 TaxID=3034019 RepID=UPI0023F63862|nr:hypothetical protein [Hymenobacter sp. YC55]MDF7814324.1 hypothetical protein [Hymenobacter sp. YC55]